MRNFRFFLPEVTVIVLPLFFFDLCQQTMVPRSFEENVCNSISVPAEMWGQGGGPHCLIYVVGMGQEL